MIGYSFYDALGARWVMRHQVLMPLTMPHALTGVSVADAQQLRKFHHAYLIRWDSGFDKYPESEWWHVIKDSPEELINLSASTRSKVRRGMRAFACEKCSRDEILSEGYSVYVSAFSRYSTHERCIGKDEFVENIRLLPKEVEFWCVRDVVSKELVAFSENIVRDNACFYNTIWFQPSALKRYSSYALFHEMNKYYLNAPGIKYVSDGARNISHQTSIHQFLIERFGFRKAYAQLHVAYAPGMYAIINILYPFRNWIKRIPGNFFHKISVVLEQERIRRACNILPEVT